MTDTQKVLAARLVMPKTAKYPEQLFYFASLDGELWLSVSDDPRLATVETIADLFSAKGKRTIPMRISRSFLARQGATFLTGETHA